MAGHVREILVKNRGGFFMRFRVRWHEGGTPDTGNYPSPQDKRIDLAPYGLAPGTPLLPQVKAVAGKTNVGPYVNYHPHGGLAIHKVTGATLTFNVHLESVHQFPEGSKVSVSKSETLGLNKWAFQIIEEGGNKLAFSDRVAVGGDIAKVYGAHKSPPEGTVLVSHVMGRDVAAIDKNGPPFIYKKDGPLVRYRLGGLAGSVNVEYE